MHAFLLDPQGTSEQLESLNTETTGQTSLTDNGDGAPLSKNNSTLSPNSSSSTMNEIFKTQQSNMSVLSQTTTISQKSVDSAVFGSDPFSSDKADDPFANEDPFGSTNNQDDIFGEADFAKNDSFGSPILVQNGSKEPSSDPFGSASTNNAPLGKPYESLEGLFGGGTSSGSRSAVWGSESSALGAGEPLSTTNFGLGKC